MAYTNYTMSQKTSHYNLAHIFAKYWLIFADGFASKFATKSSLTLPPHLNKHVATCSSLWNISVQILPCLRPKWSKLSCKTQPLKTVVEKLLTVISALFSSMTKDIQSGHRPTKIPTVWLYASGTIQKKIYCSKMLLHMERGQLVTSCL